MTRSRPAARPGGRPLQVRPPEYRPEPGTPVLQATLEGMRRHGDQFLLATRGGAQLIVCHPRLARAVLGSGASAFAKLGRDGRNVGLRRVLGQGLLTESDPGRWRERRTAVQAALRRPGSSSFATFLRGELEVAPLRGRVRVHDAAADAIRGALDALVFGVRAAEPPLHVPLRLATASRAEAAAERRRLERIVDARRTRGSRPGTVLSELVAANGEGEAAEERLVDDLLTLYAAGVETTAAATAFTLYLLAGHQDVQAGLRRALVGSVKGGPRALAPVIDEALRLYPAIPSIPRVCVEPCVLDGYQVQPGDRVVVSLFAMQRNPSLWPRAESFEPERFSGDRSAAPRAAYRPFGFGERACVGKQLARAALTEFLGTWLPRHRFRVPAGYVLDTAVAVGLTPVDGLPLDVDPPPLRGWPDAGTGADA